MRWSEIYEADMGCLAWVVVIVVFVGTLLYGIISFLQYVWNLVNG